MDLIPHNVSYALLLLFGAFAVAVHAYSMYGTALPLSADKQFSPILESVSLAYLGGPKSYMTGFICYLSITEFLYLTLSSSSVILELSLSFIGDEDSIGALTKDSSVLNPMTPVLASSVIMTVGQFKPFSQVENAIRRIAHHVAGIPHSVYEVLSRINTFRFESDNELSTSPSVAAANVYAAEVHEAALKAGLDNLTTDYLAENIRHIFSLKSWTFGQDGARIWSGQSLAALKNSLAIVEPRQNIFEDKLKGLVRASRTTADENTTSGDADKWNELSMDAVDIRNDLSVLFALLSINQPGLQLPENAGQIQRLLKHVRQRNQAPEINALFGATVLGLLSSLALVSVFYMVSWPMRLLLDDLLLSDGTQMQALQNFSDWSDYGFLVFQRSIEVGTRDIINFGLIFFVSATVALSLRSSRMASMQWTRWRDKEMPFRQYFSVASMATLIAFLFYTLLSFYRLVIEPSFMLEGSFIPPSLLNDFRVQYSHYFLVPLTGMLCAWFVCLMTDRAPAAKSVKLFLLDGVTGLWAFRFAAFCSVLHAIIRIENGSITEVGPAIEALMVPGLIFFACFYFYGTLFTRLNTDNEK